MITKPLTILQRGMGRVARLSLFLVCALLIAATTSCGDKDDKDEPILDSGELKDYKLPWQMMFGTWVFESFTENVPNAKQENYNIKFEVLLMEPDEEDRSRADLDEVGFPLTIHTFRTELGIEVYEESNGLFSIIGKSGKPLADYNLYQATLYLYPTASRVYIYNISFDAIGTFKNNVLDIPHAVLSHSKALPNGGMDVTYREGRVVMRKIK